MVTVVLNILLENLPYIPISPLLKEDPQNWDSAWIFRIFPHLCVEEIGKGSGSQALGQLFPAGSVYTIDHKRPINCKANQVKPIKFAGISYIF